MGSVQFVLLERGGRRIACAQASSFRDSLALRTMFGRLKKSGAAEGIARENGTRTAVLSDGKEGREVRDWFLGNGDRALAEEHCHADFVEGKRAKAAVAGSAIALLVYAFLDRLVEAPQRPQAMSALLYLIPLAIGAYIGKSVVELKDDLALRGLFILHKASREAT